MYELPYLGVITVTGRDAGKFLQAQLSADIDRLQPGGAGFAGLCQPQGRAIALLLVVPGDAGYRLVCARSLVDVVLSRLRPYILRDDVRIDADESTPVSGCSGATPDAPVLEPVAGLHYRLVAGEDGHGEAFRAEELLHGVAWLDPGSSGAFLPQMLGHEELGALSFRKGCFPGQEIIARTRYLGRLKQRAVVVRFNGGPLPPDAKPILVAGEMRAEAVLVDQAATISGARVALLVARTTEPFPVETLLAQDVSRPAQGRWLEVSSKRPDAA